jgi:hypothetical protein
MSDAEWLPARDALAKLKDKSDEPERQLIACARLPHVRTRAAELKCDEQIVQEGVPLRNKFWEAVAAGGVQDWKLGVFGHSSTDHGGHFEHGEFLNWRAVGVQFYWPDIVVQLGLKDGAPTTAPHPTSELLTHLPKQQISKSQKQLFEFFEKAKVHMPGGSKPMNKQSLLKRYSEWLRKDHPSSKPVKRTAFEKWLKLHSQGVRINDQRWDSSR